MTVRPAAGVGRIVLVAIVASSLGLVVGIAIGRATAAAGAPPATIGQARTAPTPEPPTDTPPVPAVRATMPGETPHPAATRRGTASFVAAGYGRYYLALPAGPGHRVRICGAGGCVTRISTDAGPDLQRQREGRIVDLSLRDWEHVCGLPALYGLCEVAVSDPAP